LRLLKLPPAIQASIRDGELTMGHAKALITIEDPTKQIYIHQHIIQQGYPFVRQKNWLGICKGLPEKKEGKQPEPISFQVQKIQTTWHLSSVQE